MGVVCDLWLAVLDQSPPPAAIRAFWNGKENTVLERLPQSSRMWLGCTRLGEHPLPGQAGAVADLLFREGTVPDYVAPQVSEGLIDRVTATFSSVGQSTLPAADTEALRAFLLAHRGGYLLYDG